MAYVPEELARFIVEKRITIWYSVPSALILMMERGSLLERSAPNLRAVLFAGEPFPTVHLRRLMRGWPGPRYLNLYGPTETNVCTFHEVAEKDLESDAPVPIGRACSGDHVWARKADDSPAAVGEEGELMVSGPTVMLGYWGAAPQGERPYATGDIVRLREDGNYIYIGRRDQMVKLRGYRVELGDVEAALASHPAVREVAVAVAGTGAEARLRAFVVAQEPPSLLQLKQWCSQRLPRYMIIDEAVVISDLPRTRNGKIDRKRLETEGT
jgi:clorobiocin biosynthesis protein CloN4